MSRKNDSIHIIGGGLAGCEAAWQISKFGLKVNIHKMRPVKSLLKIIKLLIYLN